MPYQNPMDSYLGPHRPPPRPGAPGSQALGQYPATTTNTATPTTPPSDPYTPPGGINANQASIPTSGVQAAPTGTHQNTDPGFMNLPGVGEQYWNNNQSQVQGPSQASQYWAGAQGKMQGGTNSQNLYNQGQANIDSYYNNAQKTASTQLNNELAARGVYDSGAGLDQQGLLSANLAGQKAMAQMGYMKDLAGQADTQNNTQMGLGGSLAMNAGNQDLARFLGGGQTANMAQDAQIGRERGNLQDQLSWAGQLGGAYANQTNQALGDQKDLTKQLADMQNQLGSFNSKNYNDASNRAMSYAAVLAAMMGKAPSVNVGGGTGGGSSGGGGSGGGSSGGSGNSGGTYDSSGNPDPYGQYDQYGHDIQ